MSQSCRMNATRSRFSCSASLSSRIRFGPGKELTRDFNIGPEWPPRVLEEDVDTALHHVWSLVIGHWSFWSFAESRYQRRCENAPSEPIKSVRAMRTVKGGSVNGATPSRTYFLAVGRLIGYT